MLVIGETTQKHTEEHLKPWWCLKLEEQTKFLENLEISDAYNLLDEVTWLAGRGTFVIDPDGITRVIEVTSWPLGRNSEELIRKIEALQHMRANPGIACPAKWTKWQTTLAPSMKISGEVYEALNK